MSKHSAILLLCLMPAAGIVHCETMTLDTYYPSPAGIYTNVTVTSSTVLARDGGTVSVGSPARPGRLEVKGTAEISGNANVGGVVVPGNLTADPTDAARKIEGAIYYNTTAKKHRVFQNGAWTDLGGEAQVRLASETPCDAANEGKKAVEAGTFIADYSSQPAIQIRTVVCKKQQFGSVFYYLWGFVLPAGWRIYQPPPPPDSY